jgi:hypothetical protein
MTRPDKQEIEGIDRNHQPMKMGQGVATCRVIQHVRCAVQFIDSLWVLLTFQASLYIAI